MPRPRICELSLVRKHPRSVGNRPAGPGNDLALAGKKIPRRLEVLGAERPRRLLKRARRALRAPLFILERRNLRSLLSLLLLIVT